MRLYLVMLDKDSNCRWFGGRERWSWGIASRSKRAPLKTSLAFLRDGSVKLLTAAGNFHWEAGSVLG